MHSRWKRENRKEVKEIIEMKIENYAIKISQKNSVMVFNFITMELNEKIIVDLVIFGIDSVEQKETESLEEKALLLSRQDNERNGN